jgi:signal transduction histidine kinase
MLIASTEQRVIDATAMTANDAAAAITLDTNALVDNILRVLPETTNIAVISGSSPLERYWATEMHRIFEPYADRVHFIWLADLPFDEMLKRAAALPAHSAIFYSQYLVDKNGVPHEQDRALDELHVRANAPIFSYTDVYLGRGIVGGPLLSVSATSKRTAEVAVRILGGEAPDTIKTPPLDLGTPMFDWRELRRWGISEARLPPGSIVQFRQSSAWVRYRWQIIAITIALLAQGAIIGWLLFERFRRRRAELESRKRFLEVVHLNRSAAAGALSASVAHELNQPLGAILSNAEAAEMLLETDPPDLGQVKEILGDIRQADQHAGEIVRHMRELLKRRGKVDLQEFDLNDAIADAVNILSPEARKRGIALKAQGGRRPLPVIADRIHLQQVILNLAANGMDAMADAGPDARKLTIATALSGNGQAEVAVADFGSGIPKDKLEAVFDTFYTTKEQGTGLGLSIARTIVETYGGRIWAENKAGGGSVFRFTMPLTEPQPA